MKETKENQKSGKGWKEDKQEVLTKKGVERKAPRHREVAMKDEYSTTLRAPLFPYNAKSKDESAELADEIIEEVQENRSESTVAKDNARTAENVGDKDEPEDLVAWVKNPGKSDLKDVDTDEGEAEE